MIFLRALFCVVLFSCLSGCIGEDFIDDGLAQRERLSIVSNSNGIDTLLVGDSVLIEAKYYNKNGDEVVNDLNWSSSKLEVATIDQNGLLRGLSEGVTNIVVTSNDLQDEQLFIIWQVERIELDADRNSVLVGDSIQFDAKYFNENDVLVTTQFNWTSSNASVASIDSNGKLLSIQEGQTTVTASVNGLESNNIIVAVIQDTSSVASIEITSDTNQINIRQELQFSVVVKNINGTPLIGSHVTWSSLDLAVATINSGGLATGLSAGSSKITASAGNAVSNEISLLVSQAMTTSRSGVFSGANGYRVTGNVEMNTVGSGLVLEFADNFSSQSGPGLYIYLSNSTTGGVEIAKLPQQSRSFTVNLPSNISIDDYDYVLIWCKPFGVSFGTAQLN